MSYIGIGEHKPGALQVEEKDGSVYTFVEDDGVKHPVVSIESTGDFSCKVTIHPMTVLDESYAPEIFWMDSLSYLMSHYNVLMGYDKRRPGGSDGYYRVTVTNYAAGDDKEEFVMYPDLQDEVIILNNVMWRGI